MTDQILEELRGLRAEVRETRDELRKMNGKVARHNQTLYGPEGRGGMFDDVEVLKQLANRFTPGMTSVKTVWAAVASIAAVAAVVVSLTLGMS